MPAFKSLLSSINEADLRALIANGVREDRTLDFKREAYGGNDDARTEFLADVSALANTLGGDLVIGMEEEQGVATALSGLSGVDPDQEVLRLTQIARTGLQPRLPSLDMQPVPLAAGGHALVIRVGRSYQGPHRVILKGRNRFWARSTNGRYEPDVAELRSLFLAAPQLTARVREMRGERVAQVLAGETPVPILDHDCGLLLLHVIPLAAANTLSYAVDLERLQSQGAVWWPWAATGYNSRRNFDGFLTYTPMGVGARSYCQVFRSGMVEVVATQVVRNRESLRLLAVQPLAINLLKQLRGVLPALRASEVDPPYSVQLTLAGIRDATFVLPEDVEFVHEPAFPSRRDLLSFTDSLISETDATPDQIARAIRPTLDHLFQTAGAKTTPWFKADGSLKLG